jgi:hypothetical protein
MCNLLNNYTYTIWETRYACSLGYGAFILNLIRLVSTVVGACASESIVTISLITYPMVIDRANLDVAVGLQFGVDFFILKVSVFSVAFHSKATDSLNK